VVNNRFDVDFRDALENAAPEFFPGLNPEAPQEHARRLTTEPLDDLEP
jgi:hypothetical protein